MTVLNTRHSATVPAPIFEELLEPSDRAAILVGTAKLDNVLMALIRTKLLPPKTKGDPLDRNLQNISVKINLAERMSLISAETALLLRRMCEIRNKFAHEEVIDTAVFQKCDSLVGRILGLGTFELQYALSRAPIDVIGAYFSSNPTVGKSLQEAKSRPSFLLRICILILLDRLDKPLGSILLPFHGQKRIEVKIDVTYTSSPQSPLVINMISIDLGDTPSGSI